MYTVKIKETGEFVELVDELESDVFDNYWNSDPDIEKLEDEEGAKYYMMSQDAYDWWVNYFATAELNQDYCDKIKEEIDDEELLGELEEIISQWSEPSDIDNIHDDLEEFMKNNNIKY